MKKRLLCLTAALLTLCACARGSDAAPQGAFYLRDTVNGPVWEERAFTPQAPELADKCLEVLAALQDPPEGLRAALPADVRTLSVRVSGNVVYVDFSAEYAALSAAGRSVACAAVVHSLLRLEGLFYVSVTAAGAPQSPTYERYCTQGTFVIGS